jgi:hypothetical protein
MFKTIIRQVKTLKLTERTKIWKKDKIFSNSNKSYNATYDFCCMLLGQKKCGDCIFDKIKTK